MNRYKRKHQGENLSKGIYWILFAGVVVIIVFKIQQCRQEMSEVQKAEKDATQSSDSFPAFRPRGFARLAS